MRNYGICLLLFFVLAAACFSVGYAVTRTESVRESAVPATEYETETVDERPVAKVNADAQADTKKEEHYCLVAESGYLMVYSRKRNALYLDTHIPLTDFPDTEKERLLDGIWFPSMTEVFQYLESYTSYGSLRKNKLALQGQSRYNGERKKQEKRKTNEKEGVDHWRRCLWNDGGHYGSERGDGCDHCGAYGPGGQKDPFHRKWQM